MSIVRLVQGITLLVILSLTFVVSGHSAAYQHSLTAEKVTFDWSVDGDNLAVKLSAPTEGWVAVGFNPVKRMQGANIILGYVKKGKVKVFDEIGTKPIQHAKDVSQEGKENVTLIGGSEENGTTTIEFTIPLNSGDVHDGVIDPAGDTVVILAYGERDSRKMGHKSQATVTVNLSTGATK